MWHQPMWSGPYESPCHATMAIIQPRCRLYNQSRPAECRPVCLSVGCSCRGRHLPANAYSIDLLVVKSGSLCPFTAGFGPDLILLRYYLRIPAELVDQEGKVSIGCFHCLYLRSAAVWRHVGSPGLCIYFTPHR